jgi:hypothetical protein
MSKRLIAPFAAVAATLVLALSPVAATHGGDSEVTIGSPPSPFSQNKQNEPAVAVDQSHPNVLAAGANDNIDLEACNAGDDTTCPFTPGVGVSGISFSFNSGDIWMQPTYSGYSARTCLGVNDPPGTTTFADSCQPRTPQQGGEIGTVPWYYESGLASNGDPALSFGPRRGANGRFSWSNGSRLYYANLVGRLPGKTDRETYRGVFAIGVSRLDAPATGLTPAIAADKNSWKRPVLASRQSGVTFADKEQIWADNAASSRFFGNVYVCYVDFRAGWAAPLNVLRSNDGGDTWIQRQVTPAASVPVSPHGFGRSGCTIRTDSTGVVYVFANQFAAGLPGEGAEILVQSFDGGQTWTRPRRLFTAFDTCNYFDPVNGRCTQDGVAGARNDLGSAPSVDIANGAPTGADATNEIVLTWVDGRDGLNHEHVMFTYSTDRGRTWSAAAQIETAGDRGFYSAPAISPNGRDVYLVYNAFTTMFRESTIGPTNDRKLVGVVMHANVGAAGAVGAFTEIHRGATGDARGSSNNNLVAEFLGDYVYAVASRTFGAAVWNDVRAAADCPAIDAWRMSLQTETTADDVPTPEPNNDCPATFGNSDIFGGSYADPTP